MHVTSPDGLPGPPSRGARPAARPRRAARRHVPPGRRRGHPATRSSTSPRASNATQLVIGVSRRSRLAAAFTGPGIGATVIRESGDIDVHIVTHAAAGLRLLAPAPRRRAQPHDGSSRASPSPLVGRPAAQLGALDLPHGVLDHERRARLPAAGHRRGAGRRDLACPVRRGALGPHARLLLRRAALHAHHRRAPAASRARVLCRERAAREPRRRPGGPAYARSPAGRRGVAAARHDVGQRAPRARTRCRRW